MAAMFQNAFGRSKSTKNDRSGSMNKPLPSADGLRTNGTSTQRSGRNNVGDSMAMHLLMENALDDSGAYDVMSPDDVDSSRKELDNLVSRIDATQRKLALETKVRDASKAMNRLDKIEEANEAALRCEELRQELSNLEKQEQQLQRRLLEHTAGVLQMTHKGYLKEGPDHDMTNGDAATFDHSHFYEPSMLLDSLDGPAKPSAEQQQLIEGVQRKVEELNSKIRSSLLELEPSPQDMPGPAPRPSRNQSGEGLLDQVDYLDECLNKMRNARKLQQATSAENEEVTQNLGNINSILYRTVTRNGKDNDFKLVPPPPTEGSTAQAQVDYLRSVNECVQLHIDKTEKYDSAVGGLWELITASEPDGDYSLQKFVAKIQNMNMRFSSLQDQKDVLARQIQQQRELNESGDAQKGQQINKLQTELAESKQELDVARQETTTTLGKLTTTIEDLEAVRRQLDDATQNQASSAELESERKARQQAEAAASKADNELRDLEGRVAQLQTELTFAKADLDSAHGSRAERAAEAEAAGNTALQERVQTLETELRETISDYEAMTKATIEHEKEREQLESLVDGLRDRVESLESQANEDRIAAMGMKSPGGNTGGTSASVLRNEFKKMMKDARENHSRALRAEQEERRKLEAQVRALKKDALTRK